MSANPFTQQQSVPVGFTSSGITVNGVPVGMPTRPQNETAAVLFDVLAVVGVAATTALVLNQLVQSFKSSK